MKKGNAMLICISMLLVLAGCLPLWPKLQEYKEARAAYEKLRNLNRNPDDDPDDEWRPDFAHLKSINPDIIAWIRFPGDSPIDYPIVQRENDYYLYHLYDRTYNASGAIFIDEDNSQDFKDRNTVIYGHNMRDGSMFASLKEYDDPSYRDTHPIFYIYLPDDKQTRVTYEVWNVARTNSLDSIYDIHFADEEQFRRYLNECMKKALYLTGMCPDAHDGRVVTLSTCTGRTRAERFIVQGMQAGIDRQPYRKSDMKINMKK